MQKLSQLEGVGEVQVSGSALPAVRVELNPGALFKYGIGLEDVRAALASANANSPKGAIEEGEPALPALHQRSGQQGRPVPPLVVAYRNGAAVRLSDVAEVQDSVEDLRNLGLANGKPAVLVILYRQPGANIIETVDGVKAVLPAARRRRCRAMSTSCWRPTAAPRSAPRCPTPQRTLLIAVGLVILVVFVFLRDVRATLIPTRRGAGLDHRHVRAPCICWATASTICR